MPSRTMIDWDLAVATATRLSGAGPSISRPAADAVVAELKGDAARSTGLVRDYTGLDATTASGPGAPVLVVDRTGWVQANVDSFAELVGPLVEKVRESRGNPNAAVEAVGSKVTGLEVGGLLGFLSSKVLGQFDPFHATDEAAGRLLLVAPNIVQVEQELGVDPTDFRLWVCLHEETHRVQFTAVPWMRDHIRGEIDGLVDAVDLDPAKVAAMLRDGLQRVTEVVRGRDDVSLVEIFAGPEQRQAMDRLTGVMSLLEGHADVVMDGVGPQVIASVDDIRRKFDRRRQGAGYLDRVLRRLLGLDLKMAQYRDGAAFVRAVVDKVGMDDFNAVWSEPAHLPSKAEIGDPGAWVRRVHG